jgi:hypothetical protein
VNTLYKLVLTAFITGLSSTAWAYLEPVTTNHVSVGKVYSYYTCTNEFSFVNRGTRDLQNITIVSTCPCINGESNWKSVKPGGELTVKTVFKAHTVHGVFSKIIWVYYEEKGQKTSSMIKLTGEVMPLFKGVPEQDTVLHSQCTNTIFTNSFTIVATTSDFELAEPVTDNSNLLSCAWNKVSSNPNTWRVTTFIKPRQENRDIAILKIPVTGPKETEGVDLRFKLIVGSPLRISPQRLVVADSSATLSRLFSITTYSPEENPSGLTVNPAGKGVTLDTKLYSRRGMPNTGSSKTTFKANSRYTCTLTLTADALSEIRKMDKPTLTFSYPNHKDATIPVTFMDKK